MADTQDQQPQAAEEGAAAPAPPVENAAPVPEMRCINLVGFGGIRMVKVQQRQQATAAEGEVLIRIKAWSVSC